MTEPLFYLPDDSELDSPYLSPRFQELLDGGTHPFTKKVLRALQPALVTWYTEHSPDVLVFDCEPTAEASARLLKTAGVERVATVVMSRTPGSPYAGMLMPLEAVASAAVDLLGMMIQHGKRGIPELPFEQLYRGKWEEGLSLPPPG